MSTATAFFIEPNAEPLPGYRLVKRIGSGGYGEVWQATAPGGLLKAIKIIHGEVSGDRATREMKSLDRAKSLTHPFLLSIERIEIVDGHLLIVTELADATLRDRFEQCRREGLPGIPRGELIEYLRQSADALDYLFDSHALQHLDVKPENLLLRGNHIKVADFGLLKDLQENCASLVNGMTPKYSAPELFEGKPGRHCDQYSLAIVYLEMVSGCLPFSGSNIASLASQHLYAQPDLSALEPVERFAVGKALSKNPDRRFPSCEAFVKRLTHRSTSMLAPNSPATEGEGANVSEAAPPARQCSRGETHCHDGNTIETVAPEVRSLPRLLPPEEPVAYRPVLFIGIGRTGGRVLSKLRQLITDRLGQAKGLPAIQFLYVDTDEDSLQSVAAAPSKEGLTPEEVLITPLRQTQDYRGGIVCKLDSLSRRWIYNLPRSLRTQGLRALGRIALVDHADRLLAAMRRAVIDCTDSVSIATTSQYSGLCFAESDPRVFVIASIGGGTGGGMVIDAGYAIRQVLAECGFTDDYVCGVLAYSTSSAPAADHGVPTANALATLQELKYFAQPGCDYPGEMACGLAGFRSDGPTFRNTYLFDVAGASDQNALAQGLDSLAEYLLLTTVSPSLAMFDECRRLERERLGGEGLRLRTAGVSSLASDSREDPGPFAERLCGLLVQKWKLGTESTATADRGRRLDSGGLNEAQGRQSRISDTVKTLGNAEMDRIGANLLTLRQRVLGEITNKLGSDPGIFLKRLVDNCLNVASRDQSQLASTARAALQKVRAALGMDKNAAAKCETSAEGLIDSVRNRARTWGDRLGESIAAWVMDLVDARSLRVDGARQALAWVKGIIDGLNQTAVEQRDVAKQEAEAAAKALAAPESSINAVAKETLARVLLSYAQHCLNFLVHEGIATALRAVEPVLISASDQLRDIWRDLSDLTSKFIADRHDLTQASLSPDEAMGTSPSLPGPPQLAELFAKQQSKLVDELDQSIEAQFSSGQHSFRQMLVGGGHMRDELAATLRVSARRILLRAYDQSIHTYLQYLFQAAPSDQLAALLTQRLNDARPRMLDLGGAKRLLLRIPKDLDIVQVARAVEKVAQERVSVSIEDGGDVKFCYEVEDLPWEGIQTRLIRQRHDCQDLASRLHTRINIDWTLA